MPDLVIAGIPRLVASAVLGLFFVSGCASPAARVPVAALEGADPVARCRAVFQTVDRTVQEAEVADAEAHRIPHFSYLRASRFLASFRDEALDRPAFAFWLSRLRALDAEARAIELGNLPAAGRESLEATLGVAVEEAIETCAETLRRHDFPPPEDRAPKARTLRDASRVPDNYRTAWRVLGLYPLTAVPVAIGFESWKREALAPFARDPSERSGEGERTVYGPADDRRLAAAEVADILARARINPLGIPLPRAADRALLLASFAPVWIVEEKTEDDRIGRPFHEEDGIAVDTSEPVIYSRLAHSRFEGEIVLQLVYLAWFPARPLQGPFDLLGGHLDGVIWRVTLGMDGRPVLYDTMHACGCYHLFFPVPPTRRMPMPEDEDVAEEALVPIMAPVLPANARIGVHLAAVTHYVEGLSVTMPGEPAPSRLYETAAERSLSSLPHPAGGRRSLYGPSGHVPGTGRREWILLWPMGIERPGGMRQWGNHATAFVGHRHFDDPDLLDRAFAR